MSLEIKKIYIDSRYRTADSRSESDFKVELPRSFNVPEGVVAYIDDIVLPVSWNTIDDRNKNLYYQVIDNNLAVAGYFTIAVLPDNYNGATLAAVLQTRLNEAARPDSLLWNISYDYTSNELSMSFEDRRVLVSGPMTVVFYTDEDLKLGLWDNTVITNPKTLNRTLAIDNGSRVLSAEPAVRINNLDLHTTRNVYLTSSTLASYDITSNFGVDTVIKKIPVNANYNEMIFYSGSNSMDSLTVSKRSLRYIDFKLVDSLFRPIDLRGNHFSFSIIFHQGR